MTDQPPYLVRIGLIQEDAGKLLFYMLPEDGWTLRSLEYRRAGPVGESLLTATFSDGRTESLRVPRELIRVMNELRHEMASLGKGAWLSTVLNVTSEGHFRFSFNYDEKPAWFAPLEDAAYIEDLHSSTRVTERITVSVLSMGTTSRPWAVADGPPTSSTPTPRS